MLYQWDEEDLVTAGFDGADADMRDDDYFAFDRPASLIRSANPLLGTRNSNPGTRDLRLETRNPTPETWNSEDETRNTEPRTGNLEPETRDSRPEAR